MADDDQADSEVRRRFDPILPFLIDPDDPRYAGEASGSRTQALADLAGTLRAVLSGGVPLAGGFALPESIAVPAGNAQNAIQALLPTSQRQQPISALSLVDTPPPQSAVPPGNPLPGIVQDTPQPSPPPGAMTAQNGQLPSQPTDTSDPYHGYGPPPVYEVPPAPQFRDIPQPNLPDPRSSFEVFKNPLVLLATFGSLFTRKHGLAAMAAATGAMQGFQKRDNEIFTQKKEQFDESLRAAVDQNNLELQKYKVTLDRYGEKRWAEAVPSLWADAAANNDQIGMAAIRQGPEAFWSLQKQREGVNLSVQKAYEATDARNKAFDEEVTRLKQDPAIIARAEQVRRYDIPAPPAGRINPRNEAINEIVAEKGDFEGKPYEASGYAAKNKFVTGLGATTPGSPGGQVNSAKIVIHHLATLDKLIDDLGTDSNSVPFRRAAQTVQTMFGLSSAPTNFDAAVSLVSGEIVKLVEGAGGTGEDRNHVRSAFDRANSAPLLHDAIDVTREVMSARVRTLAEQAKGLHAEDRFNRLLPPDIQQELEPRRAGKTFDVEDFRRKAKAAGYSDQQIEQFLKDKGH